MERRATKRARHDDDEEPQDFGGSASALPDEEDYELRDELEALARRNEELERRLQEHETGKSSNRYWSRDEHVRFLEGLLQYGKKEVKAIAGVVGSRSSTQVRTHCQKWILKLQRSRGKDGRPLLSEKEENEELRERARLELGQIATDLGHHEDERSSPVGGATVDNNFPRPPVALPIYWSRDMEVLYGADVTLQHETPDVRLEIIHREYLRHRSVPDLKVMIHALSDYLHNMQPRPAYAPPQRGMYYSEPMQQQQQQQQQQPSHLYPQPMQVRSYPFQTQAQAAPVPQYAPVPMNQRPIIKLEEPSPMVPSLPAPFQNAYQPGPVSHSQGPIAWIPSPSPDTTMTHSRPAVTPIPGGLFADINPVRPAEARAAGPPVIHQVTSAPHNFADDDEEVSTLTSSSTGHRKPTPPNLSTPSLLISPSNFLSTPLLDPSPFDHLGRISQSHTSAFSPPAPMNAGISLSQTNSNMS